MADVFRGMNEEPGTGLPALSVPPNTPPLVLAVRLTAPAGREPDLAADASGAVVPGTGGLSVNRPWADMLSFTIPKRLRHAYPSAKFRAARGGPDSRIWSHPVSTFAQTPSEPVAFALDLTLRVDKPGHGLVEPERPMPAGDYQRALAATRPTWVVNEPLSPPTGSPSK